MIQLLSSRFPSAKFEYKYSDEDTGSNCGHYIFMGGMILFENIPDNRTNEAFELAFELRPHYKEDYELVDGNYQYKDEDE
jgi:hypothetical protein